MGLHGGNGPVTSIRTHANRQGRQWTGSGCLFLALIVGESGVAGGQDPVQVRSNLLTIEYRVNEDAFPLESVQLWYTLDRAATWIEYGLDEDRQSPFTFHAPQEGLHGLYLVVANSTGPSSLPPVRGTTPHLWAFVDATAPVVQLHSLRQTNVLGQRVLQIRWTAIDTHFGARPIEIAYQLPPDQSWHPISADRFANTGRYDWHPPDELLAPVAIRLTVTDKGGHRVHSDRQSVELTSPRLGAMQPNPLKQMPEVGAGGRDEILALSGSRRAKDQALRLFETAVAHRARGESREGIARLREAVRLDPQFARGFAEMAEMLYRIGDPDRALNAYELALRQQPTMRAALRGAAMVHRQKNEHAVAARYLRAILRHDPDDAETWMNLGDVAVFQGDEVLARECYTRATEIDPGATTVIEDARKRLALMAQVSRSYARDGN